MLEMLIVFQQGVGTDGGIWNPASFYLFKVDNRNTRTICEICSKLKITTLEPRRSGVSLLTLNRLYTLFWCFYWCFEQVNTVWEKNYIFYLEKTKGSVLLDKWIRKQEEFMFLDNNTIPKILSDFRNMNWFQTILQNHLKKKEHMSIQLSFAFLHLIWSSELRFYFFNWKNWICRRIAWRLWNL